MVAMLFCQLGHAQSLREITGGLASCEGKLRHLGIEEAPKRSTLSYANEHRPWQLYEGVFYVLLGRCQKEAAGKKRKFRFKHKLLSIDSTVIPLCLSMFDWAQYKRTKGAVKLHMVLDHDGYLPSYAVLTDGKEQDITAAKKMTFAPDTMIVFDRGYTDYAWWLLLTRKKVHFVTRLKDCAEYGVVEQREVPKNSNIIRDEVILLTAQQEIGKQALLRRIEIWVEEKNQTMVFVTDNLKLAASTIADYVAIVIHNYRFRIGLADGEPKYDDLEKPLASGVAITVPTITLEGDANGAPHYPNDAAYRKKFSGKYANRIITGGVGHNLPQEAPQAFAQAIVDADGYS